MQLKRLKTLGFWDGFRPFGAQARVIGCRGRSCARSSSGISPAINYKPFEDELGQKIYDTVSQEAWMMWLEHSKMIVNEYRLDLTSQKAHDVLKEQCGQVLLWRGRGAATRLRSGAG